MHGASRGRSQEPSPLTRSDMRSSRGEYKCEAPNEGWRRGGVSSVGSCRSYPSPTRPWRRMVAQASAQGRQRTTQFGQAGILANPDGGSVRERHLDPVIRIRHGACGRHHFTGGDNSGPAVCAVTSVRRRYGTRSIPSAPCTGQGFARSENSA